MARELKGKTKNSRRSINFIVREHHRLSLSKILVLLLPQESTRHKNPTENSQYNSDHTDTTKLNFFLLNDKFLQHIAVNKLVQHILPMQIIRTRAPPPGARSARARRTSHLSSRSPLPLARRSIRTSSSLVPPPGSPVFYHGYATTRARICGA